MSKIKINTDGISKDITPEINNNLRIIDSCLRHADWVDSSVVDGWNNVRGQINDCVNSTKKYNAWIHELNNKIVTSMNETLEEASSFQIEDIKKNDLTVK